MCFLFSISLPMDATEPVPSRHYHPVGADYYFLQLYLRRYPRAAGSHSNKAHPSHI